MKIGRCKHVVDALVGMFYGWPHGIFHQVPSFDALAKLQGRLLHYDLLTGSASPDLSNDAAAAPLRQMLEALHRWLLAELRTQGAAPGSIDEATLALEFGVAHEADASRRQTHSQGPVVRDAWGRASVARSESVEHVPTLQAVTRLPLRLSVVVRCRGRTFRHDDPPGWTISFPPFE